MPGCIDCKHFSKTNDFNGEIKHSCLLGKTDEMNKWWGKNKKRKRNTEGFTDMECHEHLVGTKKIIDVLNLLHKMNKIVDKK